jgi:murein DD-endopeptidase MepM/ murein hydrolase activator NlpD
MEAPSSGARVRGGAVALGLLLALATVALLLAGAASGSGGKGDNLGFRLQESQVKPGELLFDGERPVRLRYRFRANRSIDLRISVVGSKRGNTVAVFRNRDAEPGARLKQSWDGVTRRGTAAKDGRYEFRVGPPGRTDRFAGSFRLHGHVFPVDGPHGDRGPIGDFGAPRSGGRTHEGFDITGACGTRLQLARGGEVARAGYDPVLYGYFVLVNGRKTDESYFYSHLIAPSPLRKGERVRSGERVGAIGQTGNAAGTPCHLHFELRKHDKPVDPEPDLRDWDGWS